MTARSRSPLYSTWKAMRQRCCNPNATGYANYGGRGIKVCARWDSFDNFASDMGERPAGMTLDRWPNTNGDYEPGNCRWATPAMQTQGRRNSIYVMTEHGLVRIKEAAALAGISRVTLDYRIRKGWTGVDLFVKSLPRTRKDLRLTSSGAAAHGR